MDMGTGIDIDKSGVGRAAALMIIVTIEYCMNFARNTWNISMAWTFHKKNTGINCYLKDNDRPLVPPRPMCVRKNSLSPFCGR